MFIDSHHHLWQYNPGDYGWITDGMEVLRRDYLPSNLQANLDRTGIRGTIVVQARQTLEETRWLLSLASQFDFIRGVVGWVPLVDQGVGRLLDGLAVDKLLRGVRHVLHDEPDDAYMLRADFNRGIGLLKQFGLVYDILIFARHLDNTLLFVDRYPQQPFVVDHIAKPTITAKAFDRVWASRIRELARRQNVACKFSGVVTEVRDPAWSLELIRPYWQTVLEAFGPQRLMFGTDWPVCLLRTSYEQWIAVTRELIADLAPAEQAAIMGDTAARVYGVGQ
jgi:L-fuconolactonase